MILFSISYNKYSMISYLSRFPPLIEMAYFYPPLQHSYMNSQSSKFLDFERILPEKRVILYQFQERY